MSASLLKPKFHIPPIRPASVPRPRLIERLNGGLFHNLTLLSAPAGFGKTTLLSAWISSSSSPGAWLSLDDQDNEPGTFWRYFIAAIQTVHPEVGQTSMDLLKSPQLAPAPALLTPLLNDLALLSGTLILVLDDYHTITLPQVHEGLAFLLKYQPPSLHLVISTRIDPPLPVVSLRARGRLTELRAADLRFSLDEAVTFLDTVMGLNLTIDEVKALESRTEGWIAGLQLAALSLQGRSNPADFIAAFSGSHHYVLEYLTEEVVRRQSGPVQRFLTQTSILDRMSGPLCDAVLGEEGSSAVLTDLYRRNLFIVPLDEERCWYRYHHLFSDLLQNLLRADSTPEQMRMLHARACDWFAGNDEPYDAIKHALLAQDFERAADLVEAAAQSLVSQGRLTTLLHWMEALPDALLQSRPRLRLYHGWTLSLSGQVDAAIRILQETREAQLSLPSSPESKTILGQLAAILTGIASLREDTTLVIQEAEKALVNLPPEDRNSRARVYTALGAAYANQDKMVRAVEAWQQARDLALEAGNPFLAAVAIEMLAGIQIYHLGCLRAGAQSLWQILDMGTTPDGRLLPFTGTAYVLLSEIYLEQDDPDTAAEYLQKGITLLQQGGISYSLIHTYCALARLERARNNPEAVLEALQKAEHALGPHPMLHMAVHLIACQVRHRLWLGDIEMAARWAQCDPTITNWRLPDKLPVYLQEVVQIARARVHYARREYGRVLETLDGLAAGAANAGRLAQGIDIGLLEAMARQMLGDSGAALRSIQQPLRWAEGEGYLRSFVEVGEELIPLLKQAVSLGDQFAERILAALGVEKQEQTPAVVPFTELLLVDPLTSREQDVLNLICAGLSNQDIAGALSVTLNTVKKHSSHIYDKLGVRSRAQAIVRAQELGLC